MKIDLNKKSPFVPYELDVWFAWHPVVTERGVVVWLENVLRGYDTFGNAYYRLP